jgi:PBS lyase HEAT-like repeat-containing protein
MLPVQCKKCGHIQNAGSALVPNDTCELCGTPIYGPKAENPTMMAVLAVITLIVATVLGMPQQFLVYLAILTVFLVGNAIVRRRRYRLRETHTTLAHGRDDTIDVLVDENSPRVVEWQKALGDSYRESIADLNRQISAAALARDFTQANACMEQLAQRITALGQLGDERGIGTILDALGDAVGSYQSTRFPAAQMLRDAAIEALVAIGAPAIEPLKERLPYTDSFPALKHSLETVYERLKREYS